MRKWLYGIGFALLWLGAAMVAFSPYWGAAILAVSAGCAFGLIWIDRKAKP